MAQSGSKGWMSSWLAGAAGACVLLAADPAVAGSMWWDTGSASGLQGGSGVWSTVDACWATNNSPASGNGPFLWIDGSDAKFNTANTTATVNNVVANSVGAGSQPITLLAGGGTLTINAGGIFLDNNVLNIFCQVVLGADQMWSINNSTNQKFEAPVGGAGRLTVRMAGSSQNGSLVLTNAASAFNSFTTFGIGGSPSSYGGLSVAAGTITNGLTLGLPGGSPTNGAKLSIVGVGMATSTVGAVTLASPAILTFVTTGSTNTFVADSITRQGHATLAVGTPNGTSLRFFLTNTVPPVNNNIVAPWMVNSVYNSFFTYSSSSGLLAAAARSLSAFDAASATSFVQCSSAITLSGDAQVQALYNAGYKLDLSGRTLTLGNGTYAGACLYGTLTNSAPASGLLDFGSAEAMIYVNAGSTATNWARLSATNGLVKGGGGALVLGADTPVNGPVWLNDGTLTLRPTADVTCSNGIVGSGSLTKDGACTATLSGTTNAVSQLVVGGGSLVVTNAQLAMLGVISGSSILIGNAAANSACTLAGTSAVSFAYNNQVVTVGAGGAGSTNNSLCIAGASVVSNSTLSVGSSGACGNSVVVSGGGRLTTAGTTSPIIGNTGSNNLVQVTGAGSVWQNNGASLQIGISSSGNVLRVDNGGVATNASGLQVYVGYNASALGNGLVVSGGQFFCHHEFTVGRSASTGNFVVVSGGGRLTDSGSGSQASTVGPAYASGNSVTVDGAGSVWSVGNQPLVIGISTNSGNTVTANNGGVITNVGALTVGQLASASGHVLAISNRASVYAASVTAGSATAPGNQVVLGSGGLLAANTLVNGSPAAGNAIVNAGGIFEFSSVTPTITPNGAGGIALSGGTVSFRGVNTVNVTNNWGGSQLTNLTWSGANALRFNFASNTTASSQTYVFDPNLGSTNYARLELVNGSTCYRGAAGSALTIGATPGSGEMLCSNTAALVTVPFTNNGTLWLVQSTLTLATNATLNGAVVIDLNSIAAAPVLVAQSNLVLGAGSQLRFTGTPVTNLTLMTYAGQRTGTFTPQGLPPNYSVHYSSTLNGAVTLVRVSPGTTVIFR
jgi:T5SS/PEP-CTERM-associated repeat protein